MELENQKAVNKVQEGNKNFNIKLYKQISKDHKGNMVISPFSIQSVMSMALSGASGETANQIRSGLSLPEDKHLLPGMNEILQVLNYKDDTNFTLKTANRLYTQEGFNFRSDFLDINKKHYFSLPEAVDFKQKNKARNTINTWVEEQTNQKIKDLMPSDAFNSDIKMVLVNALYFKGPWKEPFETKATFKRDFYLGNGRTIQVDM
jgi:serpin B